MTKYCAVPVGTEPTGQEQEYPSIMLAVANQQQPSEYFVLPGAGGKRQALSQPQQDKLAGFRLWEANHPVCPLAIKEKELPHEELLNLLIAWGSVRDSVWASVRDSVWASVRDSVWASVGDSVRDSVWASVRDSVRDSVWASVGDSVWASVWAYVGSLFPGITVWKGAKHFGPEPLAPLRKLWLAGYVPSDDGSRLRLHRGPQAEVVLAIPKIFAGG